MTDITAKTLAGHWAVSLLKGGEVSKSELDTFIFSIYNHGERLEEMGKGSVLSEYIFNNKKDECLQLLTY